MPIGSLSLESYTPLTRWCRSHSNREKTNFNQLSTNILQACQRPCKRWPSGHNIEPFCRAETDWQNRTKRSDFVLIVRLSVVQGLAIRLGLSNDIPNELNPDCGCCDSASLNEWAIQLDGPPVIGSPCLIRAQWRWTSLSSDKANSGGRAMLTSLMRWRITPIFPTCTPSVSSNCQTCWRHLSNRGRSCIPKQPSSPHRSITCHAARI